MNKRYIDFVPARKTAVKEKSSVPKKDVYKAVPRVQGPRVTTKINRVDSNEQFGKVTDDRFKFDNESDFGVIQDLNDRFIGSTVEKRPLNDKKDEKETVKNVKAKKVLRKKPRLEDDFGRIEPLNRGAEQSKRETFKMPNSPFINQEKVVKRPLSRNAYQKEIVPPKEETKGPVTIIEKPDKDKKAGLIATIIITIILGAAAGTVAFLLLPK